MYMKSVNFTSSLPSDILQTLDSYAQKFKVPKNHIMEQALRAYFERLKQAEYTRSFKQAAGDTEMESLAEEGLEDYLNILDKP
jgi:predicted transcriptional regulator